MLTFILATDEAPGMQDAYKVLGHAIKEFGLPDHVYVIDVSSRCLFALQQGGIATQITESLHELPELEGKCKFILNSDYSDMRDCFIKDWFGKFFPKPGNEAELIRMITIIITNGTQVTSFRVNAKRLADA